MNFNGTKPIFIIACQRSGFHFLVSLLNSTDKLGHIATEGLAKLHSLRENGLLTDSEILSHFEFMITQYPNELGYWGTKIDVYSLDILKRFFELSVTDIQSISWIWLCRKNIIKQAISFINAKRSKIFHLYKSDSQNQKDLARSQGEINIEELYKECVHFYVANDIIKNFFEAHKITPYTLYYEDFVGKSTWDFTIQSIFDFVRVPYELPLNISTNRLKQSLSLPDIYNGVIKNLTNYGLPLEYTNLLENEEN